MHELALAACLMAANAAPAPSQLRVLQQHYPRAYFFRAAEGMAANKRLSYQVWDSTFSRLMGIEGKVLDEEVPGRSVRNIDFFTRFKKRHPEQLVLLHYNGNARDPRDGTQDYFAGHWVYAAGCRILSNVPAVSGETDIKVDDARPFRVNMGRYRDSNDDVGLCMIDQKGRPDWRQGEQVQLVSVDLERKTLRVRRGCYGTKPMAFPAGKAYAASHVTEGPWGRHSHLLWFYNFSTQCPRDERGRNCVDVYVDDFARHFLPGGALEAFDGVEFDVLYHRRFGRGGPYGPDCNADGQPDAGIIDGINTYGIGVVDFVRRLRAKIGDDRLILADGHSPDNVRAFGLLNGIESEGWPTLSDWEIRDWSGGLNRHLFWNQNGRAPVFHYINHKYVTAGDKPGVTKQPSVPFSTHRLVLAAAQFTDAAVCYSSAPRPEPGERLGIWDELHKGTDHKPGWLGRPRGPAVRMATRTPDLLRGMGNPMTSALMERIDGKGVRVSLEQGALCIQSKEPSGDSMRFQLRAVPCGGPDLFVHMTIRGKPMAHYPPEVGRLVWVGVAGPELITQEPPATGMCIRGGEDTPLDPESGACVRFLRERQFAGETHAAYLAHPPYRKGVGYTFWEREVRVPEAGELRFYTGMGEKAPSRSDGVVFSVFAALSDAGPSAPRRKLFEANQVKSEWVPRTVPLDQYAGKRVRLRFVCDCGPKNNSTTDHSHWGDAQVVARGREHTKSASAMTWCGERPFAAGFYLDAIKSRTIDLDFRVEGCEPIWISGLTVHAHPDAIYREFDNGLVLASPAPREYTFDMARLFPDQRFRRLQGSSRQDPQTNDGTVVGPRLKLGPKDGMFLGRVP